MYASAAQPILRQRLAPLLQGVLLLVSAAFLAAHYLHLAADFPNHSPWMDWSKYTDEGWYGDAAIRHFQLGHWYLAGDFNPAAALPILPLLEAFVFQFTGVSVVAVRALTVTVFAGILIASWFLLRRWSPPRAFNPGIAVLLLAISPFCFAFTRIAIIEPLLVFFMLLTMLAASRARGKRTVVGLGILLPVMVLTKTTALFLFPAPAFLLFAATGYQWRAWLRLAAPAAGIGTGIWFVYFFGFVSPHYLLDYRYLFSANAYTGITLANATAVLRDTLRDGSWMGALLWPLALACATCALVFFRRLQDYPLIPALILWAAGYTAFLAYHNNLQPRYYLVVAIPLTLLLPYFSEAFLPTLLPGRTLRIAAGALSVVAFAAIAMPDAAQTIHFLRHPEYTYLQAAQEIKRAIEADKTGKSRLVLSISGSDLSLMNGLPSICDDFGTLELIDRVRKYRPGWYIAWNAIEDDKMEALHLLYRVDRVATFPALDDTDRNQLILYRLDPLPMPPAIPHPIKPRRKHPQMGQQPSTTQLKH